MTADLVLPEPTVRRLDVVNSPFRCSRCGKRMVITAVPGRDIEDVCTVHDCIHCEYRRYT